MNILEAIATFIYPAYRENAQHSRELFHEQLQKRLAAENKLYQVERELETLKAHTKVVEQRYDEQRRVNADLLSVHKSLECVSELYTDKSANSQKVWLHSKIRFDRAFVERMAISPESPMAQTLALSVARSFCAAIKGLYEVFNGAPPKIEIPRNPATSSQVFPST